MDGSNLEPWQAERIAKALFPILNYLVRLKKRMEQRGFPHDDRIYLLVCDAYRTVHALSVDVHYLSCKGGVWKPTHKPDASGDTPR